MENRKMFLKTKHTSKVLTNHCKTLELDSKEFEEEEFTLRISSMPIQDRVRPLHVTWSFEDAIGASIISAMDRGEP